MFNLINNPKKQSGFIKFIIIIIIAIIILSYFGFNLRAIVESPTTQGNLGYVWGGVVFVWDTWLVGPVSYLWNDIFINLLWDSFIDNMKKIKAGEPTTIEELAPSTTVTN